MTIVFLTRFFWPHVGGVEKQVLGLGRRLVKQGDKVVVVTTKHEPMLKNNQVKDGIKIIRFSPLPIKYLGLASTWFWMIGHIKLFKQADIIHAHSVFIWYWPLRILLPKKPAYVTWHGWEGIYPIPKKNILIRKIDAWVARKNIVIHDYVTKWYRIKADRIMYPAVSILKQNYKKEARRVVYVGRLDRDTGLEIILQALALVPGLKVDFCGDGPLAKQCRRFGLVHGWLDPAPYYRRSLICLSAGVTSIMEAFAYKCLVVTAYNNVVKKDYLLMTPFKNWIKVTASPKLLAKALVRYVNKPELAKNAIDKSYQWVRLQNWENAVKVYESVWQSR